MIYDYELSKLKDEQWTEAIGLWQQFYYESDIDLRMFAGDQSFYNNLLSSQPFRLQNQLYFNHLKRIINTICGYQRRNRKTSIVIPQEPTDQQTADQLSGVMQWVMNRGNGYQV